VASSLSFAISRLTILVLLLASSSAQRAQILSLMRISNISKSSSGLEIEIPDLIKTSRPLALQPLVVLPLFRENEWLCAPTSLGSYLQGTASLRESGTDSFLVTSVKPFRAASSDTVRRWLSAGLKYCGGIKECSASSTRHAAVSAAHRKGVPVEEILKTGLVRCVADLRQTLSTKYSTRRRTLRAGGTLFRGSSPLPSKDSLC